MHNFVQTRSNFRWPVPGEDNKYKGLLINHETGERLQMWTNTESEGPTPLSTGGCDEESTNVIHDDNEDQDEDDPSTDNMLEDTDEVSTSSNPTEDWTADMEGLTFAVPLARPPN